MESKNAVIIRLIMKSTERFSINLKEHYNVWVSEGKPNLSVELESMFETSYDEMGTLLNNSTSDSFNASTTFNGISGQFVKCFRPDDEPHSLVEVPSFLQHFFKKYTAEKNR